MGQNNRIAWISYVRAVCMIGVYYCHASLYYGRQISDFWNLVEPFYVNAFFVVSGYLFFRKMQDCSFSAQTMKVSLLNVFSKLVWPTVLFSVLFFLSKEIVRGEGSFGITYFLKKTIGGESFWFTSALVIGQISLIGLLYARIKNIWTMAIFAILITSFGIWLGNMFPEESSIWEYKKGLMSVIFLWVGGVIYYYENLFLKIFSRWGSLALLVLYFLDVFLLEEYNKCTISTLNLNYLGILTGVLGSCLLIKGCRLLPSSKLLKTIGDNSILFYFFSGIFPIGFSLVGHKINSYLHCGDLFIALCVAIISLVFAYLIALFVKRWMPWTVNFNRIRG